MLEMTTGWLETYPVTHITAKSTVVGLKKKACGDMVHLKELSLTMAVISKKKL